MPELTDEQYEALAEHYAANPPEIDPAKKGTGFFTKRTGTARTITLDSFSADYLAIKAMETNKTPAEIIGDLVREKIAIGM